MVELSKKYRDNVMFAVIDTGLDKRNFEFDAGAITNVQQCQWLQPCAALLYSALMHYVHVADTFPLVHAQSVQVVVCPTPSAWTVQIQPAASPGTVTGVHTVRICVCMKTCCTMYSGQPWAIIPAASCISANAFMHETHQHTCI
jgi:hypothetical protein